MLAILQHIIGNPCKKVTKRSSHFRLDELVFDELGYEVQSLFFPKYCCFRCLGIKLSFKNTTISVINNVRVFFHLIFLKCGILLTLAQTFRASTLIPWHYFYRFLWTNIKNCGFCDHFPSAWFFYDHPVL